LDKDIHKDLKLIIITLSGALTVLAITICVQNMIKNLESENTIISLQVVLIAVILLLLSVSLLIPFHILPYIKNKQKNIKRYSPLQIEIAQKILDKEIKSANDFFIEYFKPKLLDEPFNSSDPNPNYFVSKENKSCQFLVKKFKDIIDDLIKYEYIKLKLDDTIKEFTYLRKSDYIHAHKRMEKFHDLSMIFQKDLKQKRFIILKPNKLKKLIKTKRLFVKIS